MTCVWGIEMGVATVIFHVILVILQMLLMRRRFECKKSAADSGRHGVRRIHDHLQHARGDVSIDGQPDYPFADVLDCHCFFVAIGIFSTFRRDTRRWPVKALCWPSPR